MEPKYKGLPACLNSLDLIPLEWNGVRVFAGAVPVARIKPNTGQVEGLPANPRKWSGEELNRLCKSIKETPELTVARGALLFPCGDELVALGGNMRHAAAKRLKEKTLPAFVFPEDTPAEKLMEIVIKDNGAFGEFDTVALESEWSKPLKDWGVPQWSTNSGEENGGAGQGDGGAGKGKKQDKGKSPVIQPVIHKNTWKWGRTETIINDGGRAICSVSVDNDETAVAWLHGLSVLPECRKEGRGRKILREAIIRAKEMGATTVRLKADPDTFVAGWYMREGFRHEYAENDGYVTMSRTV